MISTTRADSLGATRLLALSLAVFFLSAGVCWAKAGGTDSSFGAHGEVRTLPHERIEGPSPSIAMDSKGRIDLVGTLQSGLVAIRYRPNGQLDPTFAGNGESDLRFGAERLGVSDMALDHEGRIVIGGAQSEAQPPDGSSSNYWFAVARLNPNGAPDRSFSEDGFLASPIGVASDISAIAIDSLDRIVAVGYTASNTGYGNQEYVVARYLPTGRLDPSFSGDGIVTGQFGPHSETPATAVAIDRRGRIVVGGSAVAGPADSSHSRYALIRLTSSGHLDPTFGKQGEVQANVGKGQSGVVGVTTDKRGRIVAVGNTVSGRYGQSRDASVARFLPNGRLDRSFSGDGKAVTNIWLSVGSFAIDHLGRIVLGGNVEGPLPIAWAIARLRRDGTLDPSFGDEGISEARGLNAVSGLVIDRRRRIVAAGTDYPNRLNGAPEFILRGYQSG